MYITKQLKPLKNLMWYVDSKIVEATLAIPIRKWYSNALRVLNEHMSNSDIHF